MYWKIVVSIAFVMSTALEANSLSLTCRSRVEGQAIVTELEWQPEQTAVIICDMWDRHWCQGATERVAAMAPRMNRVIESLRNQGVFIIHAPSGCMSSYARTAARKVATMAPATTTNLKTWCYLDTNREPPLPIDDSDGGCDCKTPCCKSSPWTKQIAALSIKKTDAIADGADVFHVMEQRKIKNIILMGVHTNMCVLGRPFGIRQLCYQGKQVVLVRDLTDAMYNSRKSPYVSHAEGTQLVIEHIESYWAPTVTSDQFL